MITVEHLNYTYPHATQQTLQELNFTIQPGEIFGFLGPSGAGKSTTQKILTGLLRGYEGHAVVLGKEVSQWGSDYYEHIGVSFELPNHFLKLTALENLTYFAALYKRPTQNPQKLLDRVGLGEDSRLPVEQYSKGMKIRLNVARALLPNPDLLFLDEPTSGLDPVNARQIKELILEQKQAGRTIFLATHNMAVADELCSQVAFLVDGQIRLIDAPRALRLQHGQAQVRVEYRQSGRAGCAAFALDTLGQNEDFYRLLRSAEVQTIHTQEATLEDIFIQVTGRRLQ